ncbi:hypothetical protein JAAARDRAFT_519401 [Jaapia argillacea MUCL 33604]|uniref:Ricin B lectin domain-containing protein n=1 Tax=Jaapia argillacea MUCL 33604 TaxID=933084 RepID=A0A067QDX7_9AGAM|nr:hypothetical protein JAAARDRAFT_519401 [Jaapia argillacea MUCL 33604]
MRYIEQIFELQVRGKFKFEFRQTEGLELTDSPSVVNEAIAESGNLDTIPSPSSPPLQPHEVFNATPMSWEADANRSVHDATSLQEFEAFAWYGPIVNGYHHIQHLRLGFLICTPRFRGHVFATHMLDSKTVFGPRSSNDGTLVFGCTPGELYVDLQQHRDYQAGVGDAINSRDFSVPLPGPCYFNVRETKNEGVYTVSPPSSPSLFWSLSDDEPGTVVRLQSGETDDRNRWRFVKLSGWRN